MIKFYPSVYLGSLREENLGKYLLWRNDPSIWKWCRQNDLLNMVFHKRWFSKICLSSTEKMYEIVLDVPNFQKEPIGVCGLTSIDHFNKRAEFSLYIARGAQGRGYAKWSLLTLLHHGFYNLGLNRIWGECFEGNPANKLFEKIGMEHEGVRKEFYYKNGQFINANLWSINRSKYDSYTRPNFSTEPAKTE